MTENWKPGGSLLVKSSIYFNNSKNKKSLYDYDYEYYNPSYYSSTSGSQSKSNNSHCQSSESKPTNV